MIATQKKTTETGTLQNRLREARRNTDALFQIVRSDSLYERPIPERHRIIFYLGHLEAFDWNLLRQYNPRLKSFSPGLDRLFAFGIDPVGGGLPSDRPEDWPSVTEVVSYKEQIRQTLDSAFDPGEFENKMQGGQFSFHTLLNVAIEHRLMHAETLAYMFHQLPHERKHYQAQGSSPKVAVQNEMVEIPAGTATLGLRRGQSAPFGWDNEYDAHDVDTPAFRIDKYMVTNGEFLEFLCAGGYRDRRLWSDEDWNWRENQRVQAPSFWRNVDGEWRFQGMFEEMPLPLGWPVYVSHAEAGAYARWIKKALPTEAQWHRAAYGAFGGSDRPFPWGESTPTGSMGNFDFVRWDPVHVAAFPQNQSAFGVVGQLGNGWEWTSSQFAPFDGFAPFSFYRGYSADFFDGKHFVIKGGSARTAASMLRRSFRNWFQPHYQYAYAGFRCVSN